MRYSIDVQIAEVRREITMRRRVYPRFVAEGRMPQHEASARIEMLEAVLASLEVLRDEERPQLFGVAT